MNNNIKEQVTTFGDYARQLLDEQEIQLKSIKDDHLLSGKLARIKVFNEHLEVLKNKLQQNMDSRLASSMSMGAEQYRHLESALQQIYTEYINEYLCISFMKEED